ncbi:hypothetical protein psal_cds_1137 [Pandoravirus salinus]|uniref:BTB domain-containing protein n=1 Tax=Pandoravirus salinus TaxID=1349410 RepID=S4W0S1_9VIRU|nr:hypothetical protein psal_cds_1137 [Pandoravirus salinus]AGO85391.1 hypothetical protein psal_cds_1137 [Pandoravirus salinus]
MRKRSVGDTAADTRQPRPHASASAQGAWSAWAATEAAAWTRQMRHLWCDCVVRLCTETGCDVDDDSGDDDVSKTITAHRAVLARWPYFARLFALTGSDRSQAYEGENGRTHHRQVYDILVPFEASSVHTLVDMLYDARRLPSAIRDGECDVADLVGCALFLGADGDLLLHIVEIALDALLPDSIDAEVATAPNATVGAFLLRVLDTDIDDEIKGSLVARLAYLLSPDDLATLAASFGPWYDPAACFLPKQPVDGAVRVWGSLCDPRRQVTFGGEVGEATVTVDCAPSADNPTTMEIVIGIQGDLAGWEVSTRMFRPFSAPPAMTVSVAINNRQIYKGTRHDEGSRRPLSPFLAWQVDMRPAEPIAGARHENFIA